MVNSFSSKTIFFFCQVFTVLEERITQLQETPEKQQKMATYFRDLMDGVERSLSVNNRNKYFHLFLYVQ